MSGGTTGTGSTGQSPVTSDSAYTSKGMRQSRCTKRFAVGAASSHPDAATSAGFAAAPKDTRSGSCRTPTCPWVRGRNAAACTAGDAVVHSSKKTIDGPGSAATRCAHPGGASVTRSPRRSASPRSPTVRSANRSRSPRASRNPPRTRPRRSCPLLDRPTTGKESAPKRTPPPPPGLPRTTADRAPCLPHSLVGSLIETRGSDKTDSLDQDCGQSGFGTWAAPRGQTESSCPIAPRRRHHRIAA